MNFKFTAYSQDNPGEVIKNEIEAASREEAIEILKRNGFVIVNIEELKKNRVSLNSDIFTKKVKAKEVWAFTRQLNVMMDSGMSPLESLSEIQKTITNSRFKEIIANIRSDINNGANMSTSFAKYPDVFNKLYISLLKAGEIGGILPVALKRLSIQLESDLRLKREIVSALYYPFIVIGVALVIIVAMLVFVVPTFEEVFASAGNTLPGPTQLLVNTSEFFQSYWYLVILFVLLAIYPIKKIFAKEETKRKIYIISMKIPQVNKIIEYVNIVRFCRTLCTLLEAAVPILDAIELAADTTNNPLIIEKIPLIKQDIRSGLRMSESLTKHDILPSMYLAMLSSGEESAGLDTMLNILANIADEELENRVKNIKTFIQPIIIVVLGLIIGFIIVALYLPFFKVYENIQ